MPYRVPGSVRIIAAAGTGLLFVSIGAPAHAQSEPDAGSKEISEVVVQAQRAHYRGDVALEDLPQAVQVIDAKVLQAVGVVRLNDALDLAAGVARQNTFGGVWDSFAIRGFAGDLNVPSGYLVNGFNGARGFGGIRDTSSIERIEVLKGPGSALFGRGEPGGTVAISTKKPQFESQGSIALAGGSYAFRRAEADYTTPLNDRVAVRINGAYEDAESFRDTVESNRQFVSPSIFAKLGDASSIWYEFEWSKQEIPFDRGVLAVNNVLGLIPNSRYLGEPGDGPNVARVRGHQVQFQHDFSDTWSLLVGAAHRETALKGFGQNPDFAAGRNRFFADGRTLARQRRFSDYDSTDAVGRIELSGSASLGSMTHHLMIGADYEEFDLRRYQDRYRPPVYTATTTLAVMNAVDIYNPVYGNQPLTTPPAANTAVNFNDTEHQKALGFYLTDQIDLTEQFKFRFGGRYDKFEQNFDVRTGTRPPPQDVTEFSPQVGLVYESSDQLTWYAAWARGFRPNSGFDFQRRPFEPEEAESYEVGLKFAAFDRRINGTVAVFKMEKSNVITADPANAGFSLAIGEARSEGLELEASGELPADFRFNFAYAYTKAESASNVRDPDFGRVVAVGDPLINIPEHSANLLLFKDFKLAQRNLTVGAGVNYVDERLGETGTTFFLPSYTLVRLQASFDVTDSLVVTGEVTNLFDKQYYPSSYAALWVAPGAPRQYQIRARYEF